MVNDIAKGVNHVWMVDKDPVTCAMYLADYTLHVQPLNVYQLLQSSTKMVEAGSAVWLFDHAIACCAEYAYRTNKVHNSYRALTAMAADMPKEVFRAVYPSSKPLDEVRLEYMHHLMQLPLSLQWTYREQPDFLKFTAET